MKAPRATSIVVLFVLGVTTLLGSCGRSDIPPVMVSPENLTAINPQIRVEISTSDWWEYVFFHIYMPDSADCPEPPVATVQIGGTPGVAVSSDVWCDLMLWERDGERSYSPMMKCSNVDGAFLLLKAKSDRYAIDLMELLVYNTAAIVVGALEYGDTCGSPNWRSADIRIDRVIKGNPDESYRIPVVVKNIPDGTDGVWLLRRKKSEGCDDDVYHKLIMWIPKHRVDEFERRIERFQRRK